MVTITGPELIAERVEELLEKFPPATTSPVEFLQAQYDAGLAWVHYPEGWGGSSLPLDLQDAVDARLAEAGAPRSGKVSNPIGAGQIAMTILTYGSEDQKRRYLRSIFSAEQYWCQLFSEPGSGSDLASLVDSGRARRGRVDRQRSEGVDLGGAPVTVRHPAGPHRSRSREARRA